MWVLAHEPVWFGGVLALTAGFLLQATALGSGPLSVVQPILVLELPAALILASRVFAVPMHRREWSAAAAMTAGLAGMLYFLSPSRGQPEGVRWYAWAAGIVINLSSASIPPCSRRSSPWPGSSGGPRTSPSSEPQAG